MGSDPISGGEICIDTVHNHVHTEEMFVGSDYDSSVDTASPKYWHIKTASGHYPHVAIGVSVSASGLIELYENPTTTGDGTGITMRNMNRNASKTANATFFYDPTVSGDGTQIDVEYIPGGDRLQTRVGGQARVSTEWVLKDNEQYLVKFTPDADATAASIEIELYEESRATP